MSRFPKQRAGGWGGEECFQFSPILQIEQNITNGVAV